MMDIKMIEEKSKERLGNVRSHNMRWISSAPCPRNRNSTYVFENEITSPDFFFSFRIHYLHISVASPLPHFTVLTTSGFETRPLIYLTKKKNLVALWIVYDGKSMRKCSSVSSTNKTKKERK